MINKRPPRQALTLLEVLLALTLTTGITAAVTVLLSLSASLQTENTPELLWQRAADNVLTSIADDLIIGDLYVGDNDNTRNAKSRLSRVEIADNGKTLRITTRVKSCEMVNQIHHMISNINGPCINQYTVDNDNATLTLQILTADKRGTSVTSTTTKPRIILEHVRNWQCQLEVDKEKQTQILSIFLEGVNGVVLQRRYRIL